MWLLEEIRFEKHLSKLDESVLKMFAIPIFNSEKNDNIEQMKYLVNFYNEIISNINKLDNFKHKSIYVCFDNNNFVETYKLITLEDVLYIKDLSEIQKININNHVEMIKVMDLLRLKKN